MPAVHLANIGQRMGKLEMDSAMTDIRVNVLMQRK